MSPSNLTVLKYLILVTLVLVQKLSVFAADNICDTENCKEASQLILQGLKQEVDPCDDFYEFACGRWPISSPISKDKEESTRDTVSANRFDTRMLEILESEENNSTTRSTRIMKQYYRNCLDIETLENIGLEPIHKIIEESSGSWPLMGDVADDRDWHFVDEYYGNLTSSYSLFDIKVVPDYLTRSTNKIKIEGPIFPRTDTFLLSNRWDNNWQEEKTPYHLFIEGISKRILNDKNKNYSDSDLDEEIMKMLNFEHDLYEAVQNASDENCDEASIKKIQEYYDEYLKNDKIGGINWVKYINALFDPLDITIGDDEVVLIFIWKYISRLAELLNRTDNRTIVNYVNWKFIATFILFTNEDSRNLVFDVLDLDSVEKSSTRREECLTECRLSHALFYEYSQIYFPKKFKTDILEISETIRREIIDDILKTDWLDEETKLILEEKIKTIHLMVGFYDWYDEPSNVENYYADLDPGVTYFDNILNFVKFYNVRNLKKLRHSMNVYEWSKTLPTTFNAMYNYYFNSILFPMAYADSPIFTTDLPTAFKYGTVGFIIGHEFYHALDPYGVEFDKDWNKIAWPENTTNSYSEKINCFKNDFNRILVELDPTNNETIIVVSNGDLTKSENMGDTAGIRAAYSAYNNYYNNFIIKNKNEITRLINLEEYSSDQLFFISFATKFCHTATVNWWNKEYGKNSAEKHSPARLRINGSLQNLEGFSKAFNCKPHSRMNRKPKCIVFGNCKY